MFYGRHFQTDDFIFSKLRHHVPYEFDTDNFFLVRYLAMNFVAKNIQTDGRFTIRNSEKKVIE